MARASESARWFGVVEARKTRASVDSLTLGTSSRSRTRRASTAVSSTSKRGHGIPSSRLKCLRKPASNGALCATSTRAAGELKEAGQHLGDARRVDDHGVGDAGEHGDEGRDGLVGIDERLELAEHLAAAHLDRAELGDLRAPFGEPPVVSRSTTQNVTSDSGRPKSSNVGWMPSTVGH